MYGTGLRNYNLVAVRVRCMYAHAVQWCTTVWTFRGFTSSQTHYNILFCTKQRYAIITIMYDTTLYNTTLYYTLLHYAVSKNAILSYALLYDTILISQKLFFILFSVIRIFCPPNKTQRVIAVLNLATQQNIGILCTTLQYTTLHYTTL